ncbi:MAG: iron ABC transporter permease [Chloroflexi bacterium]|nr:iron ABC transporter permease [Chloroflexota bacterium]
MTTVSAQIRQTKWVVRRFPLFILLNLIALGLLFLVHIAVGSQYVPLADVLAVLFGQQEDSLAYTIVHDLRLPRALIALAVGAMLGLSGAILQGVTQNPLASPALMGIMPGGILALVIWLYLYGLPPTYLMPPIALGGGLLSGLGVYALSWKGGTTPIRLTLTGVLMAALLNAFSSFLLLIDQQDTATIMRWLIGSLHGRGWSHWEAILPYIVIALPLGLATAGVANVMMLGDGVARGLGMPVELARVALIFAAVALAATSVSVAGNIAFIGLMAPHIARQIVGSDHRRLLLFTTVFGSMLLLLSDIIARALTIEFAGESAIGINNLPVGAVTSMLGALFFLFLLARRGI